MCDGVWPLPAASHVDRFIHERRGSGILRCSRYQATPPAAGPAPPGPCEVHERPLRAYPRGVRLLGLGYLARLRLVAEVPVALDPLPSARLSPLRGCSHFTPTPLRGGGSEVGVARKWE